jgi:cytochrome c oxidase subunit II
VTRTTVLPTLRRALAAGLLAAAAGSLLLATGASADIFTPDAGGSPNADRVDSLYKLIFGMGLVVFVAVEGALIWSMRKYKAKKGREAAQIHGNTRLEIGWTVGAAVILVFITAVTFIQLGGIKNPERSDIDANGQPVASVGGPAQSNTLFASTDQPPPPDGNALTINVDGQQYVWRYAYPGPKRVFSYVDMVVPVGRTVILKISADDVAHSWWIPELGGKQDAIPGYTNRAWFKASKPGIFKGQCAEFCGRNHANMVARVKAVPFDEYQRWYARKAGEIQASQDAGARQRAEIVKSEGQQAAAGGSGGGAGGASGNQGKQ